MTRDNEKKDVIDGKQRRLLLLLVSGLDPSRALACKSRHTITYRNQPPSAYTWLVLAIQCCSLQLSQTSLPWTQSPRVGLLPPAKDRDERKCLLQGMPMSAAACWIQSLLAASKQRRDVAITTIAADSGPLSDSMRAQSQLECLHYAHDISSASLDIVPQGISSAET